MCPAVAIPCIILKQETFIEVPKIASVIYLFYAFVLTLCVFRDEGERRQY